MVDRYDEELFLEYVEGELPVEKRVAFENQMLQDPRLRNLVAQMVIDRHRIRTLPDEAPPTHMMDAVHERLERAMLLGSSPQEFTAPKQAASTGFRWRRMATMGAMAAMIAMVAGVFIVTFVQLANDTPIRNVGPGSLFPPGILPPSLGPRNMGMQDDASKANTTTGSNDALNTGTKDPRQSPAVAMRPTDLFPDHPTTHTGGSDGTGDTGNQANPSQPHATAAELAAARAAAAGTAESTGQFPENTTSPGAEAAAKAATAAPAPLGPMPKAAVIFNITTTDLAAAQARLTSWANAYQAKLLDTRDIADALTAAEIEVASEAAYLSAIESVIKAVGEIKPTANQPLTIEPNPKAPAVSSSAFADIALDIDAVNTAVGSKAKVTPPDTGVLVTLELTPDLLLPLETFLATLSGTDVQRTDSAAPAKPAQAKQTKFAIVPPMVLQPLPADEKSISTSFSPDPTLFDKLLPIWLTDPTAWPQPAEPATKVVRVKIIDKR